MSTRVEGAEPPVILITAKAILADLRRAAAICGDGYQPGSIERGLLDAFAQDAP